MAGPLDILRGLGGGGGGGGGGDAARTQLPAYSASDAKTLAQVVKSFKAITAEVNKGGKGWEKLGDARTLRQAHIALGLLRDAQKSFNKVMQDGSATMNARIAAYDKLAKAQKRSSDQLRKTEHDLNESRGMAGRFKNVLDELGRNKGLAILGALAKDLTMVFGDMNKQFDIMARSGQLTDTTFSGLAKTTGIMAYEMRTSMLSATLMGISADDSNKAFMKLTETFGGTLEVARSLGADWAEMAKLARMSGLGMTDMANLADQGFKRLGESIGTSMNNIVAMSKVTQELNMRFGKGKVNTKEFASAVNTLAYSSGFYNQNTKMVIETLAREISMQLALGKSRTAATESAVENLKLAGQVNIVGVQKFRKELLDQFNATKEGSDERKAFVEKMTTDFGSEGELIVNMMKSGRLQTAEGLLTFQEVVKGSTKLQGSMLENMRVMALEGPQQLLAMGLDFGKALKMTAESNFMADKLSDIAKGEPGAVERLFSGKGEKTAAQKKLIAELQAKPEMSRQEMMQKFYTTPGAEALTKEAAKEAGVTEKDWKDYVKGKGVGWFLGVTNILNTIGAFLSKMPTALGLVIAGLVMRKGMGSAIPGAGRAAGRFGAGMGTRDIGGGGRFGRAGAAMGKGMRATRGALNTTGGAMAATYLLTSQVTGWVEGWNKAGEILGKAEEHVTTTDRLAAGLGQAMENLSMGMLKAEDVAKGETGIQKFFYNLIAKPFETSDADLIAQGEAGQKKKMADDQKRQALFAAQKADPAFKHITTPVVADEAEAQAKGGTPGSTSVPKPSAAAGQRSGGAKSGKATASISGGHLILEVSNWEDVLAGSLHNLSANAG